MGETIDVDFQGESRHGIYRDVPTVTQDRLGVKRSVRLTLQEATDEDGQRWEAALSQRGAYQRIRLGSEGVTHRGRKRFNLTYRVERILQRFPDHDELYWNATGTEWAVPLRRVSATVRLPRPVAPGELRAVAYTGVYGSRGSDVQIETQGEDTLSCTVTRSLNPFEGLTIVAGWPGGLIPMPTAAQKVRRFFQDNWLFGIPLVALLLMWGIWWRFGRDPARETIAVQYGPPDGLTPGEVGALVDDKVDLRDITATVIDLARRGYLTIEKTHGDYLLRQKKTQDNDLKPHESKLLNALFKSKLDRVDEIFGRLGGSVPAVHKFFRDSLTSLVNKAKADHPEIAKPSDTIAISQLENSFYTELPGIRKALYDSLITAGCWRSRPDFTRYKWWGVAVVAAIVTWFLTGSGGQGGTFLLFWSIPWVVVAIATLSKQPVVSAICFIALALAWFAISQSEEISWPSMASVFMTSGIIASFGTWMPCKTVQGVRVLERILGFEEFLRRTDRDRLRRESDPDALFEKMLPYAMALGVANQWARAFEGLYQAKPSWYQSYDGTTFTPTDFTSRINSVAGSMGTAMASTPRSSGGSGFGGGGFSGGGGGGGGGGAW